MLKLSIEEKGRIIRILNDKRVRCPITIFIKEEDELGTRNLLRVQCVNKYSISPADDMEYLSFLEREQMIQNTRPEQRKKSISGSPNINLNLKITK